MKRLENKIVFKPNNTENRHRTQNRLLPRTNGTESLSQYRYLQPRNGCT